MTSDKCEICGSVEKLQSLTLCDCCFHKHADFMIKLIGENILLKSYIEKENNKNEN